MAEGRLEGKLEVAQKMVSMDFDNSAIMQITDLSLADLHTLREPMV